MRAFGLMLMASLFTGIAAAQVPVSGVVVDAAGRPLGNVSITADLDWRTTADRLAKPDLVTDDQGRFDGELPDDSSTIIIVAPGQMARRMQLRESFGIVRRQLGRIVLHRGYVLVGRCTTPEGEPIEGARLTTSLMTNVRRLAGFPAVTPSSTALSDERGRFRLPCSAPGALSLTISKSGFAARKIEPVGLGVPLSIELTPTGFATGSLGRRPLEHERLHVQFHCDYPVFGSAFALVQRDGSFRLPIPQVGPFQLSEYGGSARTPTLRGAPTNVQLSSAKTPGETFLVRALDGDRAVDSFAASFFWIGGASVTRYGGAARAHQVRTARGEVAFARQTPRSEIMVMVVRAEGFAETFVDFKAVPESGLLEVPLRAGRTIRGRVVESKSGQPISGARVWTMPIAPDGTQGRMSTRSVYSNRQVVTDADGRFALPDHSAELAYELIAVHEDYLLRPNLKITPGAGDLDTDAIELGTGRAVQIQIAGSRGPAIVELESQSQRPRDQVFACGYPRRHESALLSNTAVLKPVTEGPHSVTLTRTSRGWLGHPIESDLLEVRITKNTETIELAAPRLYQITGRVAGVPFHRVAAAARVSNPRRPARAAAVALLDAGGRYELDVEPGSYDIELVDILTGYAFYRVPQVRVTEEQHQLDLAPKFAELRVELEGGSQSGGLLAASRITIQNTANDRAQGTAGLFEPDAGVHAWTLLVAPGSHRVEVRPHGGKTEAAPKPAVRSTTARLRQPNVVKVPIPRR